MHRVSDKHLVIILAIVTVPVVVGVYGSSPHVWGDAARNLLAQHSMYHVSESPAGPNPHTTSYVYLPVFAILLSIVSTPFLLVKYLLDTQFGVFVLTSDIVAGVVGYASYLAILILIYRYSNVEYRRYLLLSFGLLPYVLLNVGFRGSDLFVLALVLSGLVAYHTDDYLFAGVLLSLSTFKFTTVPLVTVFGLYVLTTKRGALGVTLGGLIGQLPNAAYYVLFPSDFWLLIDSRGALSTYSYRLHPERAYWWLIEYLGITQSYYVDVVYPALILSCILIGYLVARRDLLVGLLWPLVAMSVFIPAEQRLLPLLVLCIFVLVPLTDRLDGLVVFLVLVSVSVYRVVFGVLLGGHRYVYLRDGTALLFQLEFLLLIVVVYVTVVYCYGAWSSSSLIGPSA